MFFAQNVEAGTEGSAEPLEVQVRSLTGMYNKTFAGVFQIVNRNPDVPIESQKNIDVNCGEGYEALQELQVLFEEVNSKATKDEGDAKVEDSSATANAEVDTGTADGEDDEEDQEDEEGKGEEGEGADEASAEQNNQGAANQMIPLAQQPMQGQEMMQQQPPAEEGYGADGEQEEDEEDQTSPKKKKRKKSRRTKRNSLNGGYEIGEELGDEELDDEELDDEKDDDEEDERTSSLGKKFKKLKDNIFGKNRRDKTDVKSTVRDLLGIDNDDEEEDPSNDDDWDADDDREDSERDTSRTRRSSRVKDSEDSAKVQDEADEDELDEDEIEDSDEDDNGESSSETKPQSAQKKARNKKTAIKDKVAISEQTEKEDSDETDSEEEEGNDPEEDGDTGENGVTEETPQDEADTIATAKTIQERHSEVRKSPLASKRTGNGGNILSQYTDIKVPKIVIEQDMLGNRIRDWNTADLIRAGDKRDDGTLTPEEWWKTELSKDPENNYIKGDNMFNSWEF